MRLISSSMKPKVLCLAYLTAAPLIRQNQFSVLAFHANRQAAFVVPRTSRDLVGKAFQHFSSSSSVTDSSIPPSQEEPSSSIVYDEPSRVVQRVFDTDKRPVILFDGVCNLCNGAVNTALDWDPKGKLRFSALQSNVGQALLQANGRSADDISSIVLVTEDGAYVKSDAILRITEALTPFRLLPLKPAAVLGRWVVPRFLRDIIYDGVANNRYDLMGKRNECRFDADGEFEDRFVNDDLALKQM